MESFSYLMCTIGAASQGLDFAVNLPQEVVQIIFKKLDAKSLIAASHVSRRWLEVCKADPQLRRCARRHLRRERRRALRGGLPSGIPSMRTASTLPQSLRKISSQTVVVDNDQLIMRRLRMAVVNNVNSVKKVGRNITKACRI
jgi:hypothetical protein